MKQPNPMMKMRLRSRIYHSGERWIKNKLTPEEKENRINKMLTELGKTYLHRWKNFRIGEGDE